MRVWLCVECDNLHAEALGDANHVTPDVAGADDAEYLARQIKALQTVRGESTGASTLDSLGQAVAEGEQKCKDVLCDGIFAICWDVAHGHATLDAIADIDVVVAGRA